MKDLYRQLGFDGQVDDLVQIRTASLAHPDRAIAQNAEEVLMRPSRKAAYDRQRSLMQVIGRMRAKLGLSETSEWQKHGGDFKWSLRAETPDTNRKLHGYQLLHRRTLLGLAPVAGIVLVLAVLSVAGTFCDSKKPAPNESAVHSNLTVVGTHAIPTRRPWPLPRNGELIFAGSAELVAPLSIETREGQGHFFVKLVGRGTGKTALTFFVREGQKAEVEAPLGSYELRYATGRSWFGPKELFGDKTQCARALEPLDFAVQGDSVRGFAIRLYLQVDGNLATKVMSPEDF